MKLQWLGKENNRFENGCRRRRDVVVTADGQIAGIRKCPTTSYRGTHQWGIKSSNALNVAQDIST